MARSRSRVIGSIPGLSRGRKGKWAARGALDWGSQPLGVTTQEGEAMDIYLGKTIFTGVEL